MHSIGSMPLRFQNMVACLSHRAYCEDDMRRNQSIQILTRVASLIRVEVTHAECAMLCSNHCADTA